MKHRLRAVFPVGKVLARLGPALVLALGLFAYRPLFSNTLSLPTRFEVERWFFLPDLKITLIASGIAGWLLWRRRARLESLPARNQRAMTAALLAVGTGLFIWAQANGTGDLLLPSLAANLLAFASATKGRPGCRAILVPVLLLVLAVPIPVPIRSELVWQLQQWTARGATWVLQVAGYEAALSGVVIEVGERSFTVIDSCSGLRGIEILTLIALVVRDLFAASGRRQWLLLSVAPVLGFAINVLRVAVVVVTTEAPQVPGRPAEDHTPQGVAVLLAGTVLLYALGWWMATTEARRPSPRATPSLRFHGSPPGLRWRTAATWLTVLGTLSVTVPPLFEPPAPRYSPIEIPKERLGWKGEDLTPDWLFAGVVPRHAVLYRRYEQEPRRNGIPHVVELFTAFEANGEGLASSLFTSKTALPGRDWSIEESRKVRLWTLGVDGELALASRDSGQALVYIWRLRDRGLWRETARSLLGLDAGPFRREPGRVIIRLTTPLVHEGPVAEDRAKKTLDRFILDFRDVLANL